MSKKIKNQDKKTKKQSVIDEDIAYYKEDDARNIKDSEIIKRLFKYMKKYRNEFIFIIISILISSALMTLMPIFFKNVMDLLKEEAEFSEIMSYGYFIIGTIVLAYSISLIRGLAMNKMGQKILYEMREELFSHIENLSLKELDKVPVGKFVTRVTNDTNNLSDFFTNVLVTLVGETMSLIYAVIMMFILSAKITLIVLSLTPILIGITALFRYLSRKQFRKITYSNSAINSFLSENLSGMKITQIFNKEDAKMQEFDVKSERLKRSHARSVLIFAIFRPTIFVLYFCGEFIAIYFGAKEVIAQQVLDPLLITFTSGSLYSFYLYISQFFNPIQNIAQQFNVMQSAFASTEKIFTILNTKSSIVIKDEAVLADNFQGEIEFRDVWFRYEEDWIIKGISFHVSPGETVALVGPTGAGKTTILSLVMRYYDVEKGEILIDGINVKDYDAKSLRRNIGEMLQDVFLFTGTIKDNITLKEDIPMEEIIQSSTYVNANSFIDKLPNKYDEVVKERGNNYSQGQRQLLSFARTIVHHPKMIILDEATSNIDTETEVLIQDSLEKIKTIGTTLIVAHRLSTIQHSDKILFIDDGKVVESGNHQELLKLRGRYYKLYELQYED